MANKTHDKEKNHCCQDFMSKKDGFKEQFYKVIKLV